jgi:hypothetical protein
MDQSPFQSEDLLQQLLAEHPEILADDMTDGGSSARWLLVDREFDIPGEDGGAGRWSLDHLFLDSAGVPTLVEVKRSSDTRIRREVVGQMLDYAANAVVYWPPELLRERFEARCAGSAGDPEALIRELTGAAPDDERAVDVFWETVRTNLRAGKIRMVFVADEIPNELRRIVEFLGSQMDPAQVLAIEVRQFLGAGVQTLVPRVLGTRVDPSPPRPEPWSEETFFQALLERRGPEAVRVARRLLEYARSRFTRVWWGRGRQDGSFVPFLELPTDSRDAILFTVWTYGRVEFTFQYLLGRPYFGEREHRAELLAKLREIPGLDLPADAVDRRPTVPLEALAPAGGLEALFGVMDWAIGKLKGA